MSTLRDEAIVLRTYKSGEADRVVVMWTKEHGKLKALARGVRKGTSKLGSGLEPLAHIDVLLADARGDFHIVRQVEHVELFSRLRLDLDRLTAGCALTEVVEAVPLDGVPDREIFIMLSRALASLDNTNFHPYLVPAAFYLKLLVLDGSAPQLDECVTCGSSDGLSSFDAEIGGALCSDCHRGRLLSSDALALMRRLLGGDLAGVLSDDPPPGSYEVHELAIEALERHFGRRLKVARSARPPETSRDDR
ncbi:MAG: DNA repair protein RecO [Acidobacteria bacterium]|nr:DNA repair protein RecO [Acidobacteriota bacterium]